MNPANVAVTLAVLIGLFISFGHVPSSVPRKTGYVIVRGGSILLKSANQQK